MSAVSNPVTTTAASYLDWLWSGLNSNFSTALLGAFAGAYAGAWASQKIAENKELLNELRNTNAAVIASFTAFNGAMALKRQHVKPLYDKFHETKAALQAFQKEVAEHPDPVVGEFQCVCDFRSFPAPTLPLDILRDLLFHKITAIGRPLSLVCTLEDAARSLANMIAMRGALIEEMGPLPQRLKVMNYFGLPFPEGSVNQRYPDTVDGIYSYTDDVCYFSYLLCNDLMAHGKAVHSKLPRHLRKSVKPAEIDFSKARNAGLLPPDSQYADWHAGFKRRTADQSEK